MIARSRRMLSRYNMQWVVNWREYSISAERFVFSWDEELVCWPVFDGREYRECSVRYMFEGK